MKVVIADKFEAPGIEQLGAAGCEVVYEPSLKNDALRDALARESADVLIVRSTRVTEPILAASGQLSLVVRAGAGYNTIDVRAASNRSILVANCPGRNAVAVGELTFALILALDRRVVDNTNALRSGKWDKKEYARARGLKGRTLGLIGFGRIGRVVALRAHAFEMHMVGWSRSLTDELAADYNIVRCQSPIEVASRCDVLSIHLASTGQTSRIINADVLNQLKPGSYVINTARAEVMDYQALALAVRERRLRVGLDVYSEEPAEGQGSFADPIIKAGGVIYGTHHIGASTEQAQAAIADETVRIVRTFLEAGHVLNCVNLRATGGAPWCLRVRHRNEPGVLAHVMGELSKAGINVEEMENMITSGERAACAHIRLDAKPPSETLRCIENGSDGVLATTLTQGRSS